MSDCDASSTMTRSKEPRCGGRLSETANARRDEGEKGNTADDGDSPGHFTTAFSDAAALNGRAASPVSPSRSLMAVN